MRDDQNLARIRHGVLQRAGCGTGNPSDKLTEVFQPFYQADNIPKNDGFGPGLSIAKGIVEAHGGSITAWSKPGEGAVFTVRLPLQASPQLKV